MSVSKKQPFCLMMVCQLPKLQNPQKHYPKIVDYIWPCLLLLTCLNHFHSLGFSTTCSETNLQRRSMPFDFVFFLNGASYCFAGKTIFIGLLSLSLIYYFKMPLKKKTNKGSVVRVCDLWGPWIRIRSLMLDTAPWYKAMEHINFIFLLTDSFLDNQI